MAESVDPPNNNGYERTLVEGIARAVDALLPFVDKKRAAAEGGFRHEPDVPLRAVHPEAPRAARRFHSFAG